MKTIYHVNVEVFGEQDFFFDDDGKLIHWWDRNDADYRNEYMDPLMKELGIKVKSGNWSDKRFKSQIKEILIDCGASEEEFE